MYSNMKHLKNIIRTPAGLYRLIYIITRNTTLHSNVTSIIKVIK